MASTCDVCGYKNSEASPILSACTTYKLSLKSVTIECRNLWSNGCIRLMLHNVEIEPTSTSD